MENSCEVGNDQSSGWLEVKKKHRGSSKFSIHSVGRESSRKNSNGKGGNSHRKLTAESLKAGSVFHSHFQGILPPSTCIKKQNEEIKSYSTMCVVGADSACSSELASKTKTLAGAGSRFAQKKIACHEKLDAVPKLKWGDLEDDDYFPGHDNSSASEIKFGEIGDDDLAICKMSENATDMSLFNASQGHAEGADNVFKTEDAGHDTEHYSLDNMTEDNCKKITGALKNTVEFSTTRNKELDLCAGVSDIAVSSQYVSPVDNESISNKSLYMDKDQNGCTAYATVTEKVSESILSTDLGDSAISNIAYVSSEQGSAISCQGTEAITLDWIADLTCQRDTATTHSMDTKAMLDSGEKLGGVEMFEENKSSNAEELSRKISRAHIMSSLGEKEEGKSKERFRERLWCFLFENLNRAVEELYLLCELECDLEQVTEAVLVLEEAGSDFKELNTRIKEFDKLKRNSTRLAEEALMTMKSDHRRPHALSWEVRRMTTTPRRAEILSSSLEAFKKIQAERVKMQAASDQNVLGRNWWCGNPVASDVSNKYVTPESTADTEVKSRKNNSIFNPTQASLLKEKKCTETDGSNKLNLCRSYRLSSLGTSIHDQGVSRFPSEGTPSTIVGERSKREQGSSVQPEKRLNFSYQPKSQIASNKEKEKEKTFVSWKSMDAWKEKRNWEEILASPCRMSSRLSHSPYMSRKSAERARILHDKLLSSEKKKKTALDLKREAEEKHARAMRIRNELENERAQKLQKTSEKLNRVSEWQAVRSMKLREGMHARHQRSESRHVAHIAQVVRRAGDESIKVNEVRFITSLNEENKKFMLRQKLHDSQIRRAEKLQVLKIKQKEEMAREEAVLERRKLIEAEKLQRLAEIQRKKEVAQSRREEERKASSTAREAKAMEQLRRREERAKAQQEEAEMLAQKLAERLSENEQRRKVYLEQIRERASMDLRDHCSPLVRRSLGKDTQGRSTPTSGGEDYLANIASGSGDSHRASSSAEIQHVLKRRVKKIRQRLMALKHDFLEPSLPENSGIGYRTTLANARAKVGRWLQDLQRYRLARKDGASNIGLITAEMIKFLEGKEVELQASRQAGLLNFISSTLPASHISKPESCQVTINMLRLLKVVLVVPINRVFFLSQNLLPPIIPMLSAALENYIKIAASLNSPNSSNLSTSKASSENFDSISEVIDGILWTVTMIVGHESSDERHIQMQDGLLELVVSHQIIHRLRDLFALYDKPQVDGSPFPSSILLSINLLVTLTSRQRDISSINWDSFSCEDIQKEVSLPSIPGDADSYDSCLSYPIGDHTSPAIDGNLAELHATGEVEHFGILCESKRGGVDYVTAAAESLKELKNSLITSNLTDGVTKEESKRNAGAAIPGASIPQKGDKKPMDKSVEGKNEKLTRCKSPQGALVTAISETGLVSLLSLLTAVLLQANSRSSEQPSYVLPSNFEEVATGVLKVLNNLAVGDLTFMQQMLARPDLKMEFFHIMSFLLTHCTNQWKTPSDQIGLLLSESLLLLGYFSLFHPENQAVLRWGKSPTILHKVCDLPFVFFSDPELMPLLAGALVAACFGCKQNKGVVQQELSIEMLVSMVKSCKSTISKENALLESADKLLNSETLKLVQQAAEPAPHKFGRPTMRNGGGGSRQSIIVKGCAPGNGGSNNNRSRARILKDSRVGSSRAFDEVNNSSRHNNKVVVAVTPDRTITGLMLHCRFPESFINRVEKFFAMEDDQQPG